MEISKLYNIYSKYFLVDTDTRKIRPNTIFFALKGANFNGNTFAKEALRKGAILSIVDDKKYATNSSIILVDDVLKTLQKLAKYHREKLQIPIIALTGSNGKTTTKELINVVLNKKYNTTATFGNLNNHIGVPLTLLSMTPKTEIGIVEMGANHPKEIAFLASITLPDFGYITNFGKAHLEGFGSLEGVINAKSELYDFLQSNNKTAFVNPNDKIQQAKTKHINRVLFDSSIQFINVSPFIIINYNNIKITTNLIGSYNFNNIAVAITIGNYFGISANNIKNAIEHYTPNNNRSQIIKSNTNEIILDAYNANPTSMKAALENFNLLANKQKTVILGDMFEIGTTSDEEHQKIVDLATSYSFDCIIFVGKHFYKTTTKHLKFETFNYLKEHLKKHPIKNNYVLIKGSRGMALERSLEFID